MEVLNRLYTSINNLDRRQFYQLVVAILASIVLIMTMFTLFYWYKKSGLEEQFITINEQREDVKKILDRAAQVTYQRKEVEKLLEEDGSFKISGYFETVLKQLGLSSKKADTPRVQTQAEQGQYSLDILTASLRELSTKNVVELLSEIGKNPRLYVRELNLKKSRKVVNSLDVTISIAALQPAAIQARG